MSHQEGEAMYLPDFVDPIVEDGQANDMFIDAVNEGMREASIKATDGCSVTAATSGSINGESRSSQGQDRSLRGKSVSKSEEEGIKEVLIENTPMAAQNEGLGKLQAYLVHNDENAVPEDAFSFSKMTQDEEFSLNLSSRPTGTGSHQLELWIREVNNAVRGPPPLSIRTERVTPKENPVAALTPRAVLSPATENGQSVFSPSNRTGCASPINCAAPQKKAATGDVQPSLTSARSPEGDVPVEDIHPEDPRFQEATPRVHNSQFVLANIEDQYKNLREDLIRDPTLDDLHSTDEEGENDDESACQSPRHRLQSPRHRYESPQHRSQSPRHMIQNETALVHSMVSRALTTRNIARPDFAMRDHFSLGMLSTRSSGILSANSWDSASSFGSEPSFIPDNKGCGLFLCE